MIAALGLDPTATLALLALLTGAVTAVAGAIWGGRKTKAETESIATKTTLEVNEALREELAENRKEAQRLRETLHKRDLELEALQRKFAALRRDFDVLEAEINALRGARRG